jgi:translation initiation factor IF-3
LLDRLAGELSEIGVVEQSPVQDGRNMTMLLAPSKAVLAGEKDGKEKPADAGEPKGETEPAGSPDGEQPSADAEQPSANGEQPSAEAEPSSANGEQAPADAAQPEPVQAESSTAA